MHSLTHSRPIVKSLCTWFSAGTLHPSYSTAPSLPLLSLLTHPLPASSPLRQIDDTSTDAFAAYNPYGGAYKSVTCSPRGTTLMAIVATHTNDHHPGVPLSSPPLRRGVDVQDDETATLGQLNDMLPVRVEGGSG